MAILTLVSSRLVLRRLGLVASLLGTDAINEAMGSSETIGNGNSKI